METPTPRPPRKLHGPIDPNLPKVRKKSLSGMVMSAGAIFIVLFSTGQLPQIDGLFTKLNDSLRAHNDDVVRFILHAVPIILFVFGALGLGLILLSAARARRKPLPEESSPLKTV